MRTEHNTAAASCDQKCTAILTGLTTPKKERTTNNSQLLKDVETCGGNTTVGDTERTNNKEVHIMQPKGSRVAHESSARSTGSWKTMCHTEKEEDTELKREGVMLIEESSKANGQTGKAKGKAVKAKVVDDDTNEEDSDTELGEWCTCCTTHGS